MECPKWEELGLLFSADELSPDQAAEYRQHIQSCSWCREESSAYEEEHRRYFTPEILCEAPSAAVDREILRVCSDPRRKVAGLSFFPAFIRKALVPMALLLMGFVTFGYISFNVYNAKQLKSLAARTQVAPAPQAVQPIAHPAVPAVASAADSQNQNKPITNFSGTRGNLNDKGVITVDLKK